MFRGKAARTGETLENIEKKKKGNLGKWSDGVLVKYKHAATDKSVSH
jgi:hypothetical protein